MSHLYEAGFYDYIEQGSSRSAAIFAARILPELPIGSLLDVGCGRGAWLRGWQGAGVADIFGVDGDYVDQATLLIDRASFAPKNLNEPLDLGRRFDLVQSLEVAEHLDPARSEDFVASLARHGDIVLFSAAVVGQGGEYHINEHEIEDWRGMFGRLGYAAYDVIRPLVRDAKTVEPWYRYNTILYANAAGAGRLPARWRAGRAPDGISLHEGGDLRWRLRRALVARLPRAAVDVIARANAARVARAYARSKAAS